MSKQLSTFYPFVVPHVIGVPIPLMDQALRWAATEFCRATNVVQELDTQDITANNGDYDVNVPAEMNLTCVLDVWYGDAALDAIGPDIVTSGVALRGNVGTAVARSGSPTGYYQKAVNDPTISVYPVPDSAMTLGLAIRASFEPTNAATTLPDVLFDRHANELAFGALAYLTSLPNQPFSNPVNASAYSAAFETAKARNRAVSRTGRIRRSIRVQQRPFA